MCIRDRLAGDQHTQQAAGEGQRHREQDDEGGQQAPVSYTHLDVYKRQGSTLTVTKTREPNASLIIQSEDTRSCTLTLQVPRQTLANLSLIHILHPPHLPGQAGGQQDLPHPEGHQDRGLLPHHLYDRCPA